MSGHDPLALAEWQRVRRYAVPERMIAECAEARSRGDWRAACAAGRIDVDDSVSELAAHLAPDLLRWHLPRALGGDTTLAVDRCYVLVPGDTIIGPETVLLTVDAPLSVHGSQRLTLGTARWGDLDPGRVLPVPAYLWDVRFAGELRTAAGDAGTSPAAADRPAAFAAAGFLVDSFPVADWPELRTVDPARLAHDVRWFAQRFGLSAWTLRTDYSPYLRFDVAGDTVRVSWGSGDGDRSLPRISPDLVRHPVDVDLVRAGRLTVGEVHPLVRAALFPGTEPTGPPPTAEPSMAPPPTAAPHPDGPVRVRCRGGWHEIGVRLGRLDLLSHTDTERQRERALNAFGGTVSGCFAVERSWHGTPGRLPRRLRAHREDLWQRMIHGGTRTVFELLDAGMNPQLRDSRGRTLLHRVRSFDHARLLPRLLAAGLDVNARDKEGSTPLYLAVVHRWPAGLITALSDAGADPHLPNQGGMSVIEHFEEILDYHEDLDPDFEAAVAYLRKHAV